MLGDRKMYHHTGSTCSSFNTIDCFKEEITTEIVTEVKRVLRGKLLLII